MVEKALSRPLPGAALGGHRGSEGQLADPLYGSRRTSLGTEGTLCAGKFEALLSQTPHPPVRPPSVRAQHECLIDGSLQARARLRSTHGTDRLAVVAAQNDTRACAPRAGRWRHDLLRLAVNGSSTRPCSLCAVVGLRRIFSAVVGRRRLFLRAVIGRRRLRHDLRTVCRLVAIRVRRQ